MPRSSLATGQQQVALPEAVSSLCRLVSHPSDLYLRYTIDVLKRFSNDSRVAIWDLYNEPECSQQVPTVLPLLREVYSAALSANPNQPLTFGILPGPLDGSLAQFELASSDIITFHGYEPLAQIMEQVAALRAFNRPLICTEYMARSAGSTFHTHTLFFNKEKIGAVNWGLVAGKTQTYFPWRSPANAPTPLVWFHDIFNASGTPYSQYEVQFLRELTGSAPTSSSARHVVHAAFIFLCLMIAFRTA